MTTTEMATLHFPAPSDVRLPEQKPIIVTIPKIPEDLEARVGELSSQIADRVTRSSEDSVNEGTVNHYNKYSTQFLAGGLSSVTAQILVHPVDTAKTLAQNGQPILRSPRSLYRGLTGGVAKLALRGACQQPTMGMWSSFLLSKGDEKDGKAVLPLWKVSLAGSLAGVSLVPLSQLCEYFKIQFQTGRSTSLTGLMHRSITHPGVVARGMSLTTLRNMIGCGTYFYTYDKTNRFFKPDATLGSNKMDSFSSWARVFLAGATAGTVVWTIQLPIDTLKTMAQAQDPYAPARPLSCLWRELLAERGFRGMYRGLRFVYARSILINGLNMSLFELYSGLLSP